jgi:methylase of polypeptide subunit release factors
MEDPSVYLTHLINREIGYRFSGIDLSFALSHGLFSSAGVDSGTHALLATLADIGLPGEVAEVIDVGCGTGVAGIALASAGESILSAFDRDCLAAWFTEQNAMRNGLDGAQVAAALGIPDLDPRGRRCVVCNMPAKAGRPVIEHMIGAVAAAAGPDGTGAIVIVRTLAGLLSDTVRNLGADVITSRGSPNHLVVAFRGIDDAKREGSAAETHRAGELRPEGEGIAPGTEPVPTCYFRTRSSFIGPTHPYELQTAYNIPEFDNLAFRTALAFDLLRGMTLHGTTAVYGVGQGHLAVACRQRTQGDPPLITADRDLLALRVTAGNVPASKPHAVPTLGSLTEKLPARSVDFLVINSDPIPGSQWNQEVTDTGKYLLTKSGRLLVTGRSTTVSRLLKHAGTSFVQRASRKTHGFRADLLALKH